MTHHTFLDSTGQNSVVWTYLNARNAGQCLVVCPGIKGKGHSEQRLCLCQRLPYTHMLCKQLNFYHFFLGAIYIYQSLCSLEDYRDYRCWDTGSILFTPTLPKVQLFFMTDGEEVRQSTKYVQSLRELSSLRRTDHERVLVLALDCKPPKVGSSSLPFSNSSFLSFCNELGCCVKYSKHHEINVKDSSLARSIRFPLFCSCSF